MSEEDDVRSPGEQRVADAMAAHGAQVRPDPGAWDRIDARLDERRSSGASGVRRPLLVAAAATVLIVLVGAVVVRARSTDGEVQVATAPEAGELSIVAVDSVGRLVELGPDGIERRVIYQPSADAPLTGAIAVSPSDGTVYAERLVSGTCSSGASTPYGEVVGISFDDGSVSVAVPLGAHPSVAPTGDRLAYLMPPDGGPCSPTGTPMVGVVDLQSDDRTSYRPTVLLGDELTTGYGAPSGTDLSVGDPTAVLDLAWDADGSLLVLVGSARSADAWVQRVTYSDDLAVYTVADTPHIGGVRPSSPSAGDLGLYTDSFAPMGSGRVVVGGRVHDEVGTKVGEATVYGGAVEAFDVGVGASAGGPVGTTVDLHLSAEQMGLEPILVDGLSYDDETGRLLLVVHGWPGDIPDLGAAYEADSDPSVVAEAAVTSHSQLLSWDGRSVSALGTGYRSAAWIRPSREVAPPPPSAVTDSTATTVAPAGTTLTQATLPDPAVTAPSLGQDRPEDAAAITDAFRAFFEQGDRSALEGSGVLEPALQDGAATVTDGGQGVTVTIDAIVFESETEAEVRFRMDQSGNFVTAPTIGSAVFVDGRWKVSAATMCTLLSRVQIPCPTEP